MINIYNYLRYSLSLYVCAWFGYFVTIYSLFIANFTPYVEELWQAIFFQSTPVIDYEFYLSLLPYVFIILICTIIFITLAKFEKRRINIIPKTNINILDIIHCGFVTLGIINLFLYLLWFFTGEIACQIQLILK